MGTAIMELSGGVFIDVLNPDVSEVTIEMIAHALSHQNRFGGHTPKAYSVAQHSVYVSFLCDEEDAFDGLMHDATEALLLDIPNPIKKLWPFYYELEKQLHTRLADKFGFKHEIPASVKEADARICITEKISMFGPEGLDGPGWSPLTSRFSAYDNFTIQPTHPEGARESFLRRYEELKP